MKLAGITPSGDAADDYLDALAALHERGQLDDPEVQKHAAALSETAARTVEWYAQKMEREERERQAARCGLASTTTAPVTVADFEDPWDELRDEFEQFLDEIEPEEEAG